MDFWRSDSFNRHCLDMAMKIRGYENSDLANQLNVLDMQIATWLEGAQVPSYAYIREIARLLEFPLKFFFSDYEPPKNRHVFIEYSEDFEDNED